MRGQVVAGLEKNFQAALEQRGAVRVGKLDKGRPSQQIVVGLSKSAGSAAGQQVIGRPGATEVAGNDEVQGDLALGEAGQFNVAVGATRGHFIETGPKLIRLERLKTIFSGRDDGLGDHFDVGGACLHGAPEFSCDSR